MKLVYQGQNIIKQWQQWQCNHNIPPCKNPISWHYRKCSSFLLHFATRARELYFYTHPAITVVLQDINREDSVKWKSDLITFYFKKKTSLFF